jgi:hypothetical protein
MKILQLMRLADAAELGLSLLQQEHARNDARAALDAALLEIRKRSELREISRANRPSRTIRREAIRKQLSIDHYKVRLTRHGHWHVQSSPGTAWLLFALSDADAENLLTQ